MAIAAIGIKQLLFSSQQSNDTQFQVCYTLEQERATSLQLYDAAIETYKNVILSWEPVQTVNVYARSVRTFYASFSRRTLLE